MARFSFLLFLEAGGDGGKIGRVWEKKRKCLLVTIEFGWKKKTLLVFATGHRIKSKSDPYDFLLRFFEKMKLAILRKWLLCFEKSRTGGGVRSSINFLHSSVT